MLLHRFCLSVLCFSIFISGIAQQATKKYKAVGDVKIADDFFRNKNFNLALEEYLLLIKKEPDSEKYNYRLGVCYLNTAIDKKEAVKYFEKIKDNSTEVELKYLLGRAYSYSYRFDDAIKMFNSYKKEGKGAANNLQDIDKQVQYAMNAKEIMKFPLNISFENLGKNINSEYPDYFPFIPSDESFLIYNSKRPESASTQRSDGSWRANIYFSKAKDGDYIKSKPLGRVINSIGGDEEAVGLSANGEYLLLYFDNLEGSGDIYISKSDKNQNFKEPMIFADQINSLKGQEISASITSDANTVYFASNRAGGFGGSDLYVCRRLPNGKWSPALNLGKGVNTDMNEDFPTISPDGTTLYFSSTGHTSMGGYDIFISKWSDTLQQFGDAKNIGYPLNTSQDDMNFRVSATGKYGYISARKPDGFGDMDIYRVDFLDVEPEYTVITGRVKSMDMTKPADSLHAAISVVDNKTGEEFGSYLPNPYSGRYVVILPPGKFTINATVASFIPYKEAITILGKNSYKPLMEKDIFVSPDPAGSSK